MSPSTDTEPPLPCQIQAGSPMRGPRSKTARNTSKRALPARLNPDLPLGRASSSRQMRALSAHDGGLHGKYAVAAVLIHRFISLKVLITVAWLIYHYVAGRRRGYAPESAPSSPQSTAPLHNENASITLSLIFFEFNATGRTPFDDMSTPQKCPLTRHYLQTTSGNRPIWGVPFRCAPDTARMRMYQGVRHRRNG